MTFTIRSAAVSAIGRHLLGAAVALTIASCQKDLTMKATKSECDQACSHAVGLNKGERDTLTENCPILCIEREWTVGDVACLNDATSYDSAKNCAVAAKVALADAKKQQTLQAILAAQQQQDAEQKKLQAQLKEQNDKIERLLADLTNAKDEAQRAAIQKQLEEMQEAKKKLVGGKATNTGPGSPNKKCDCAPADPLCSCL